MAFRPLKRLENSELKRIVLANAVGSSTLTVKIGDLIQPGATTHTKFATDAATTGKILGVVTSIIEAGKVSELTSIVGVNSAGTGQNTGNDNETTGLWSVDYIPSSLPIEYEADISAVSGTTTDSGGIGTYFTITSGTPGTVLESSALIWSTATSSATQITSLGYTAYNTLKIKCRISPTFVM